MSKGQGHMVIKCKLYSPWQSGPAWVCLSIQLLKFSSLMIVLGIELLFYWVFNYRAFMLVGMKSHFSTPAGIETPWQKRQKLDLLRAYIIETTRGCLYHQYCPKLFGNWPHCHPSWQTQLPHAVILPYLLFGWH